MSISPKIGTLEAKLGSLCCLFVYSSFASLQEVICLSPKRKPLFLIFEFLFFFLKKFSFEKLCFLCFAFGVLCFWGGMCSVQDWIALVVLCFVQGERAAPLIITNNAQITSGGIKPHNR